MKQLTAYAGFGALLGTAWFAYDMVRRTSDELLWGWRPLFLLVFAWLCVLILIGRRLSEEGKRWLTLTSLSGLLLSLGFPPSPMIPLIFVALVPLLLVEYEISQEKGGVARWTVFKYAFNAFLIWNICTTWWILNTSFLPGIVANVLNSIFMATVFMMYHQVRHLLGQRMHWLILAAFWIAFEHLHNSWEISWPWLNFGHVFAQYPSWVQWYEYTGIFGGSLWVLAVNSWIWNIYRERMKSGVWPRRQAIGVMLVILFPIAFGVTQYYSYDIPDGDTEIAIIQPNFEPHYEKFNYSQRDQLKRFVALSDSILTPETRYLVYPETSFGYVRINDIEKDYRIRAMKDIVALHPGLKLVTGLATYVEYDEYVDIPTIRISERTNDTIYYEVQNSAIQIAEGQEIDPYFKSKLVPGPEILPYRRLLFFLEPLIALLDGTSAGHTRQKEREVFPSNTARIAPIICYESIYGAYVGGYLKKGADILFIVTNDGWWDDTPGHIQHLKLGALRAIEHRRPIARSANTGISCFINERGDILQPTEYGETTAIRGKLNSDPPVVTFYTRWGDVIARVCVFITGLFIILGVARAWQDRVA